MVHQVIVRLVWSSQLYMQFAAVLGACCAAGLPCWGPAVLRACRATGLLCCGPAVLRACCAGGLLCCGPAVLRACCATGLLCYGPALLRACCAEQVVEADEAVFEGIETKFATLTAGLLPKLVSPAEVTK